MSGNEMRSAASTVGVLRGVLGRAPHPDEVAAALHGAGADAGEVVAESLRALGCSAAGDRPGRHGTGLVVPALARLLGVLGVGAGSVVAVSLREERVAVALSSPAGPPAGFVAESDLVWALHRGVSAGRLVQLGETVGSSLPGLVAVGPDLALSLAACGRVRVEAESDDVFGRLLASLVAGGAFVDQRGHEWVVSTAETGEVSVWSSTSPDAEVTVVAGVEGLVVEPWGFLGRLPEPAGESAGPVPHRESRVRVVPALPGPVGSEAALGEWVWGAPVLELVAAAERHRVGSSRPVSGAVAAARDAVLAKERVELSLLGAEPVVVGVEGSLQPKVLAVLCFLGACGPASGDVLHEAFWAGSARSAMENALTKLRRFLEPGGAEVVYDRDERLYRLEGVGVDLDRFARLAAMAADDVAVADRLALGAAALELVPGGPVLAGMAGELWSWWHDDPDCYAHVEHLVLSTAEWVAAGALATGDAELVERACAVGLSVVPGHERLGQLAMAAAHVGGDRDGVRSAYRLLERCVKSLDPDDAVSAETEDLYRSLLARDTA